MSTLVQLALILAAVIHLLPVLGVLGSGQLQRLYGVHPPSPDVALLLRHRAVLFAGLGVLLLVPLGWPEWLIPVCSAGLVSAVSFLVLAWGARPLHPAMRRVVIADIVAIAALVLAMTLAVV